MNDTVGLATTPSRDDGLPSSAIDDATWERLHRRSVSTLRDLIRLRTVNPPGDEVLAARYLEAALTEAGLRPEIVEPFPGRASIAAHLRGDGTGGDPLLLLSHLDVVPAPPDGWSHDPFGADVADGYVWGRGAVDMKGMVALEVEVLRRLAEEARAVGRDPASDPIPGMRRDVLFACTADEEAGGIQGAGWVVEHRPDWVRAAGALNECGGVSVDFGGRRFYPIGVAEKGYANYRVTVHGAWGHGSLPRSDNATVLAAEVITRLATAGPVRPTSVMARFFDVVGSELGGPTGELVRQVTDLDPVRSEAAIDRLCDPMYGRAARALLRDTVSPDVVHAGVKYNVIPGVAEIEVDCRTLPGTDEAAMRAALLERLGPELAAVCRVEPFLVAPAVEAPLDTELYALLGETLRAHDPAGIPLPVMMPFATDAKHVAVKLGVPTYGFSPLRLDADERFLDRFHGVDERVSLEALRFGLPVLYDVVRGFCG